MKKLILIVSVLSITFSSIAQNTISFSFTALNNAAYVQLDSISVKNLSQDCDTVLYYPDTVLTIYPVGIKEDIYHQDELCLMQSYPNPAKYTTSIAFYVPVKDGVRITVSDVNGRLLIASERQLEKGLHTFLFTPPGDGLYLFNASCSGTSNTIKILVTGTGNGRQGSLEYSGCTQEVRDLKSISVALGFLFNPGDELMLIGYSDGMESGLFDSPETDQGYTFQFATNIPCPGVDSLYYDQQWYHTIQIFSQCWIIENMNAGIMIPSVQSQTNNDIIEKYCMGDIEYYCSLLGGLYFWNEMMKYTNETGGQGICPDGFHVPRDMEWQILEGSVDSVYEIGSPAWNVNGWRGTDAGGNLKQTGTEFWEYPNSGATDAFGFSAIAGGYYVQDAFWGPGYKAYFWSSELIGKYYRNMDWNQVKVQRYTLSMEAGISVRCLKD